MKLTPTPKGKPKSQIHKYFEQIQGKFNDQLFYFNFQYLQFSISGTDGKIRAKCYTCQEFVSNQAQRLKNHFAKCSSSNKLNMDSKVVKRLTTVGFKRPSGTGGGEGTIKMGRKLDRVRELFDQAYDENGCIKQKCSHCGHLVSNQSGRMRKHIEKCDGHPESLSPSSSKRKSYSSSKSSSMKAESQEGPSFALDAGQEISPASSNTPIEPYPNPNASGESLMQI